MSKTNSQTDDEVLILACQRGDAAAWEALVTRYQQLIYTIPRRAGLDEDLAGEVFQRTFAALLQHVQRIDQPERVRAWLVTTARRETERIASRQRKVEPLTGRSDPHNETAIVPELTDQSPLPDVIFQQLEEHHQVRTALNALEERCRQLLTLLFYQAETPPYSEIASSLGIREGSIGPIRARCLQRLRRLLEEVYFFPAFLLCTIETGFVGLSSLNHYG